MNLRGVAFNNFGSGVFTNQGTLNVIGTNTVSFSVPFHDQGVVNVGVGRLALNGGGSETTSFSRKMDRSTILMASLRGRCSIPGQ